MIAFLIIVVFFKKNKYEHIGMQHVNTRTLGEKSFIPTKADFYDGAKLLIAADCTAYAYANMHEEFM